MKERRKMAEPTQFTYSWSEITELLIKAQNIHEGKWMAAIEFAINVGLMGQAPPNAFPGAMLFANTLQLTKAPDGAPSNLVVDAAVVNPEK
jgi:hypothetical protein